MENSKLFTGRTLLVGFEGWSDAAEGASGAANFMALQSGAQIAYAVDPEDFYDFQYNRPTVSTDEDGTRQLEWPGVELYVPDQDTVIENSFERLFFLFGAEPSRNWRMFTAEVIDWITEQDIQSVIFLGSIPSDAPHTRPIAVSQTSQNELVRHTYGIERSNYHGPVGIQTVLSLELEKLGIPCMSLWAAVPHYVQNGPSPKAMLALISAVEQYLDVEFDHTDLATEAFEWERNIDELAENDEEMSSYIRTLEESRDAADKANVSGDELALEFERFLASQPEPEAKDGEDQA